MGQIIQFPSAGKLQANQKTRALGTGSREMLDKKFNAEIILFTGVQYDRNVSLPSQRILPPLVRN